MIADQQLEVDFIQVVLGMGEESPGRLNAALAKEAVVQELFTQRWLFQVFQAAKEVSRKGECLSPANVRAAGSGIDSISLGQLWPVVPSRSGVGVILSRLRELRQRRAAEEIGERILEAARDVASPHGAGLVVAASALQAAYASDGNAIANGHDVLHGFYEELERAQSGDFGVLSVQTGIRVFDDVLGGLPRKFLTIVGAYPGCFKSGLMATIAANLAARGVKVGFFSLEDNPTWIAKRYLSRQTGIPVSELSRRRLSSYELEKVGAGQDRMAEIMGNIYFDSRSGVSGIDVAASARWMIAEKDVQVVIVDHLGEMKSQDIRKDRYDLEIASNVRAVRDVAKDTGVAVLMAAHLRRKQDGSEDISRTPTMSDFADSASIERMARVAIGLWNPPDMPSEICLKVLKMNEGGARGTVFQLKKDPMSAMVKND